MESWILNKGTRLFYDLQVSQPMLHKCQEINHGWLHYNFIAGNVFFRLLFVPLSLVIVNLITSGDLRLTFSVTDKRSLMNTFSWALATASRNYSLSRIWESAGQWYTHVSEVSRSVSVIITPTTLISKRHVFNGNNNHRLGSWSATNPCDKNWLVICASNVEVRQCQLKM